MLVKGATGLRMCYTINIAGITIAKNLRSCTFEISFFFFIISFNLFQTYDIIHIGIENILKSRAAFM